MTIDEKTYQQYTERIQRGDFLPDTVQAPLPTPEEDIEARVAEYRKQCQQTIEARDRTIARLNAQLNTDHITADMLAAQRAQTDLAVGQAEGIEAKMQQQAKDFEEEKKKLEAQIAELQDKLEDQKHETDYHKQRAEELKDENKNLVRHLDELQEKADEYDAIKEEERAKQDPEWDKAMECQFKRIEEENKRKRKRDKLEAQIEVWNCVHDHILDRARKYKYETLPYYVPIKNCCDFFARTLGSPERSAVRDILDLIEDEYKSVVKEEEARENSARIAATQPKVEAQTVVFGAPHSTTHVDNANQNDKLLTDGRD